MLSTVQASGLIALHMKMSFKEMCGEAEVCREARSFILDDSLIGLLTDIAIGGTIIECASVEAERETLRVLEGLEARLREKIVVLYDEGRKGVALGRIERTNGRGEVVS